MDPVVTVANSVSTVSFDLVASPVDTFVYQIAAVGKDGIEGPAAQGNPIINTSAVTCSKIHFTPPFVGSIAGLCIDRHGTMYVNFYDAILELDSTGIILGTAYVPVNYPVNFSAFGKTNLPVDQMRTDSAGNFYSLHYLRGQNGRREATIMKMKSGLAVSRELPIADFNENCEYSMAVSAQGIILLYAESPRISADSAPASTRVQIFDSAFTKIADYSIPQRRYISNAFAGDDTVLCLVSDKTQDNYRIISFDNNFSEISVQVTLDFKDLFPDFASSVPQEYTNPGSWPYFGFKNIFGLRYYPNYPNTIEMLFIFDDQKLPIARIPYTNELNQGIFFGYGGNIYRVSSNDPNTILKYSLAGMLTPNTK